MHESSLGIDPRSLYYTLMEFGDKFYCYYWKDLMKSDSEEKLIQVSEWCW